MRSLSLNNPYTLAREQQTSFRRDGFIYLPSVCSRLEIDFIRPHIVGIVDEVAKRNDTQERISDYSKIFTQVTNVWRMNETVRAFIFAKRFARIAAELVGVRGVRLYHDQALIKEPGGKPTPWHQDHYYWPLATEHTVTMWMPLIDCPHEMGTMSFAAGSHTNPAFAEMPISETSQEYFSRIIAEQNLTPSHFSLKAGDATFHYGKTLHSAPANATAHRREVITIIYYADGTRLMEPDKFNEHRKVDMEVFHPGQRPGEIAASALNPLLWFENNEGGFYVRH
jgi:ectoine hydroxylase-related dioxygenase (phytanoyl-CoA dioxygenase family)